MESPVAFPQFLVTKHMMDEGRALLLLPRRWILDTDTETAIDALEVGDMERGLHYLVLEAAGQRHDALFAHVRLEERGAFFFDGYGARGSRDPRGCSRGDEKRRGQQREGRSCRTEAAQTEHDDDSTKSASAEALMATSDDCAAVVSTSACFFVRMAGLSARYWRNCESETPDVLVTWRHKHMPYIR